MSARRGRRAAQGIVQPPFRQVPLRYPPVEVLSADHLEAIHRAALRVLAEVGLRVLSAEARGLYAGAGAEVAGDRVRLDPALAEGLLATIPPRFTLSARNPARDLLVGDGHMVFSSVGGPAYVMDNAGRRDGTLAEMRDYLRLVQALNVLHQEGGGPFEPMDLPAPTRHLDVMRAEAELLDKSWQGPSLGRARTLDGIAMAALALGTTPEGLLGRPTVMGIINTNSPLQLDGPMAEGLIELARHGQVAVVTPFTLAGAMAPLTLAGALAQQHAEAIAGLALTQVVRPGAPAMYGGFTSNVDMRSGSPAFGTPEYAKAAQASGQLARRLRVPSRSSNVSAANEVDAQAAWESLMALWGAVMGGAHLVEHAAGWMHGGLTASFEKLIVDAELLGTVAAYLEPIAVDEGSLALDAIREVGPGGHFFGAAHTLARYGTAFHAPLLSSWDSWETWRAKGSVTARERAHAVWTRLLEDHEDPGIEPAVAEALDAYVARRKEEGGAPLN